MKKDKVYNEEFGVEVCRDGRIYKKGKLLKQNIGHYGYRRVNAVYGRTTFVHRLVAMAFCDGRSAEKNIVDHIDGNVSNNKAENLRWVTNRENVVFGRDRRFAELGFVAKTDEENVKKKTFVELIKKRADNGQKVYNFNLRIKMSDALKLCEIAESKNYLTIKALICELINNEIKKYK